MNPYKLIGNILKWAFVAFATLTILMAVALVGYNLSMLWGWNSFWGAALGIGIAFAGVGLFMLSFALIIYLSIHGLDKWDDLRDNWDRKKYLKSAQESAHKTALSEAQAVYDKYKGQTLVTKEFDGPGFHAYTAASPYREAWDVYFDAMDAHGFSARDTKKRFDMELQQ